jgi:hypothetical protein
LSTQTGKQVGAGPVKAGISGAIIGAFSGGLIGWSFAEEQGAVAGALAGGLYFGLVEAVTDVRRQPGEMKPLWHRIIGTTIFTAAVAVVVGLLVKNPLALGLIMGLLVGKTGLGPKKIAMGLGVGLVVGLLAQTAGPEFNAALIGGSIALIYRLLLQLFFRDSAYLQMTGERVSPEEARFVVPFEAHTKYIGADYAQTLARESDGTFKRNQPDIGIVESLDTLRGPNFNPDHLDPLICEFYEHTSRFKLTIEPEWNPFIKPFFWVFKNLIAQRIGQANLPFNTEEAQRGMVSYIDTIDYEAECGPSDCIRTLRAWIRAYEDSGEAIYVGIYTIIRHEETGYVSVGFPLPEANFTATLMPFNNRGSGLLLKTTATGSTFPGHYLSDIDEDDGTITTLELPTMDEEIEVYVEEGQLKTEHRFYLSGSRFLTLHYSIEREVGSSGRE